MAGYAELQFPTMEEAEKFEADYDKLVSAVDIYIKECEKADKEEIEHTLMFWVTLRENVTRKAFQLCGYDIAEMGI